MDDGWLVVLALDWKMVFGYELVISTFFWMPDKFDGKSKLMKSKLKNRLNIFMN